jgi:sugar lactone lactonase YvrE
MRVSKDGGALTTIASGIDATSIAVDETSVYLTVATEQAVMKVPLAGGQVTTLAYDQMDPDGIAVDQSSVYWTNFGVDGTIIKLTPK